MRTVVVVVGEMLLPANKFFVCVVVVFLVASIQVSYEQCDHVVERRNDQCNTLKLRLPNDYTGLYVLKFNASLPFVTQENIQIRLDNEKELSHRIVSHFDFTIIHPTCSPHLKPYLVIFNGRVLCQDEPYDSAVQSVTNAYSQYFVNATLQAQGGNEGGGSFGGGNHFHQPPPPPVQHFENEDYFSPFNNKPPSSSNNNNGIYTYLVDEFGHPIPINQNGNQFVHNHATTHRPTLQTRPTPPRTTTQRPRPLPPRTTSAPSRPAYGLENSAICGEQSISTPLILGGETVQEGEYPWMSALFRDMQTFVCTSSIISDRHILTAAHCVYSFEAHQLTIGYGSVDISRTERMQIVGVQKIVMHNHYKVTQPAHDIALLAPEYPIIFSNAVKPLCVWFNRQPLPDPNGLVAGWGLTSKEHVDASPKLMKVKMPLVSHVQCYQSNRHFSNLVTNDTFCAGNKDGNGPCKGDSGAPLFIRHRQKYYIRGIVSTALSVAGIGCDLTNYVIFADVHSELNWLRSTMRTM